MTVQERAEQAAELYAQGHTEEGLVISSQEVSAYEQGYSDAYLAAQPQWIPVTEALPDMIEGKEYSENVLAIESNHTSPLVMSLAMMWDDGKPYWCWGNNYGDIFGDSSADDEYEVTHWCPITIPPMPS